jgi:DNA repair protein RadC
MGMPTITRRPGRRVVRLMNRKRDPVLPSSLPTEDLLYVLLGNREAAQSIVAETGGDLRRLAGMELDDLTVLPGIGEGTAAKLAALFEVITRIIRGQR